MSPKTSAVTPAVNPHLPADYLERCQGQGPSREAFEAVTHPGPSAEYVYLDSTINPHLPADYEDQQRSAYTEQQKAWEFTTIEPSAHAPTFNPMAALDEAFRAAKGEPQCILIPIETLDLVQTAAARARRRATIIGFVVGAVVGVAAAVGVML